MVINNEYRLTVIKLPSPFFIALHFFAGLFFYLLPTLFVAPFFFLLSLIYYVLFSLFIYNLYLSDRYLNIKTEISTLESHAS